MNICHGVHDISICKDACVVPIQIHGFHSVVSRKISAARKEIVRSILNLLPLQPFIVPYFPSNAI